jgi:hypothetical protein
MQHDNDIAMLIATAVVLIIHSTGVNEHWRHGMNVNVRR